MKRNDAFPSKYLSKEDVPQAVSVSIARVYHTEIESDETTKTKVVIDLNGLDKPMILNATNWDALEAAYGPESDAWVGKTCEVYADPNVVYAGKKVGGLRVRVRPDWTSAQAADECKKAGITKDQLMEMIHKNGGTGWVSERDTPTLKRMIEERANPVEDMPF